jgi:hypothetical protein
MARSKSLAWNALFPSLRVRASGYWCVCTFVWNGIAQRGGLLKTTTDTTDHPTDTHTHSFFSSAAAFSPLLALSPPSMAAAGCLDVRCVVCAQNQWWMWVCLTKRGCWWGWVGVRRRALPPAPARQNSEQGVIQNPASIDPNRCMENPNAALCFFFPMPPCVCSITSGSRRLRHTHVLL